jgi:hypothetical protein
MHELSIPLDIQAKEDITNLGIFDQVNDLGNCVIGEWMGIGDSKHRDFQGIKVHFWISGDTSSAETRFLRECGDYSFDSPSSFEYGGSGYNQYCVSYWKEYRYSTDVFCQPTGMYASYVIFQKENVVITIWENSKNTQNNHKDEVIKLLAEKLAK